MKLLGKLVRRIRFVPIEECPASDHPLNNFSKEYILYQGLSFLLRGSLAPLDARINSLQVSNLSPQETLGFFLKAFRWVMYSYSSEGELKGVIPLKIVKRYFIS